MDNSTSRWSSVVENRKATNKLLRERRATSDLAPIREVSPPIVGGVPSEEDLDEARGHVAAARKAANG